MANSGLESEQQTSHSVSTPPGKSQNLFIKFQGPGKSWKMILVLEI